MKLKREVAGKIETESHMGDASVTYMSHATTKQLGAVREDDRDSGKKSNL